MRSVLGRVARIPTANFQEEKQGLQEPRGVVRSREEEGKGPDPQALVKNFGLLRWIVPTSTERFKEGDKRGDAYCF